MKKRFMPHIADLFVLAGQHVKTVSGGTELRILPADPPTEGAVLETASLENAFLYYFGEKAGAEDVQI